MRKTDKHTFFFSERDVFSNWHRSPIQYHGLSFNCNEQFMMFCKAKLFGDEIVAAKILAEPDPKQQKKLGREVSGFVQSRWDEKADHFVYVGAREKFTQHESAYDALMDTLGTKLVEASRFDKIWGIGMDQHAPGVEDEANWPGTNRLGNVLTRLRDDLALLPRPNFGAFQPARRSPSP